MCDAVFCEEQLAAAMRKSQGRGAKNSELRTTAGAQRAGRIWRARRPALHRRLGVWTVWPAPGDGEAAPRPLHASRALGGGDLAP